MSSFERLSFRARYPDIAVAHRRCESRQSFSVSRRAHRGRHPPFAMGLPLTLLLELVRARMGTAELPSESCLPHTNRSAVDTCTERAYCMAAPVCYTFRTPMKRYRLHFWSLRRCHLLGLLSLIIALHLTASYGNCILLIISTFHFRLPQ